ncbi:probable methyltransferase-like protein 24 [Haliotis rubra]|uniref:probable methyltransferase-like protein 24 n=1 Tax=Haliotis rubra TaxID=36100 RepID=UPI001EE62FCC|nr:probable methyltransferase-like protein 24 [Haliotis rubra]
MTRIRLHKLLTFLCGVLLTLMLVTSSSWFSCDLSDIPKAKVMNRLEVLQTRPSQSQAIQQVLPTEDALMGMSRKDVSQIYHDYVATIQVTCQRTIRPGRSGDGGWDVCVDPPYRLHAPCLVYSFGINFDFSFDDDIANKYGCDVHSYDPSMNVGDHLRGQRIYFHKTGLNATDVINEDGWRMRTFSSILKDNNHSQETIDLLKIDIETSELWALPEMLESGSLRHVKQLCFEMHIKRGFQDEPTKEKYIFGLSVFRNLYEYGFRIFKTHKNMYAKYISIYGMERTGCHEIYMIRKLKNILLVE